MVFPTEGQYCVYDDVASSALTSITNEPEKARLLAWVTVQGGTPVKGDLQGFLTEQLVAAAADLPEAVQAKVQRELKDGLKTSSFTWHRAVEDDEVRSTRLEKVVFNIDVATKPNRFEINGRPYASDRIDHTLVLGTAQEWSLSSERAAHPFHIHVNPFQVVSIRNKYTQEEVNEGQYAGMKGAWKDTLIVQPDVEVRIRTRYQRYIGDFVLHCHLLDHEDQGMMQNVRIVPPDGNGGAAIVGHHH